MDQVDGYRYNCKSGYTRANCETSNDLRFFFAMINEILENAIVRESGKEN